MLISDSISSFYSPSVGNMLINVFFNSSTWYSRFPPRTSPLSFECVHSFVLFFSG